MADISLGTFEVTNLSKFPFMGPGQPQTSYGATLAEPAKPGPSTGATTQVMITNLQSDAAAGKVVGQITLGTKYEIILREVT